MLSDDYNSSSAHNSLLPLNMMLLKNRRVAVCSLLAVVCALSLMCCKVQKSHSAATAAIESNVVHRRLSGPGQQNKTLVIIIGSIRGGERAWQTLYDNVLDPNNADLALMVGKVQEQYASSSLLSRAKYSWRLDEYDDWADAVDLIDGPAWREKIIPRLQPGTALGPLPGQAGSGLIIFMIRWFLSQKIQELGLTNVYDRFVITRADHYYLCLHDVNKLTLDNIWMPNGQDYTGLTDRHIVVSNKDVLTALDILPDILKHFELYADKLQRGVKRPPGTMHSNPEILIKRRFDLAGLTPRVKPFNRMMFTCAMPGDATRWQHASADFAPEGVLLKYEREYQLSHQYCDAQTKV